MKIILLIACALFTSFEATAMEKAKELPTLTAPVEEAVLILLSDETDAEAIHKVEISLQLAKYIGALKTFVESSDFIRVPYPLLNVTYSTWRLIEPWLEQLSDIVHDDVANVCLRTEIVAAFGKLSGQSLIEIIRASDYLEIPQLLECACEAVSKHDLCHNYTFEQISSLPKDIGNRIILQELLKELGPIPIENLLNEWIIIQGPDALQASCIMEDGMTISGFQEGTLSVNDREGNELAQWKAHTDIVLSIDVTQDGTIVSSSGDGTIGVWDIKGNKIAHWKAHEARVQAVCVTKDLKIISGSHDNTVRVWRMDGTPEATFGGLGNTNVVRMTKNGTIVVGSVDKKVRVLDRKGQTLATCNGHEGPILALCITHDDKILSGSCDGTIRLWDMDGQQLAVYQGHDRWVKSLCETKDGDIISGGKDRTVRVWDRSSRRLLFLCKDHRHMIMDVSVRSDGRVVSRSQDNYMFAWKIGLLRKIIRMDELHAKVLWEWLSGQFAFLRNYDERGKNELGWLRIKELIQEQELEQKLDHWILCMRLNPKSFE